MFLQLINGISFLVEMKIIYAEGSGEEPFLNHLKNERIDPRGAMSYFAEVEIFGNTFE